MSVFIYFLDLPIPQILLIIYIESYAVPDFTDYVTM